MLVCCRFPCLVAVVAALTKAMVAFAGWHTLFASSASVRYRLAYIDLNTALVDMMGRQLHFHMQCWAAKAGSSQFTRSSRRPYNAQSASFLLLPPLLLLLPLPG